MNRREFITATGALKSRAAAARWAREYEKGWKI